MGDFYQLMQERGPERWKILSAYTGERTGKIGDFYQLIQERGPERLEAFTSWHMDVLERLETFTNRYKRENLRDLRLYQLA